MKLRTKERQDAIVAAAAGVFLDMGYERASMAEIASRAGCSKPTLYGYFASKTELLVAAITQRVGEQVSLAYEQLPALANGDPEDVLTRFGEQHIAAAASPSLVAFRRLVLTTMTERGDAEKLWQLGKKRAVDIVETYLKGATAAGRLRVDDAKTAARQLLSLYEAEIAWGGPAGFAPQLAKAQIAAAARGAVRVFLAAYGAR